MKKILMTRLSVCSLGVSCNEMIDTPMLLVVTLWYISGMQNFIISSETECSEIVLSAKKKRQIYCNLYVEDFGKSSAKLNTKSANIYF